MPISSKMVGATSAKRPFSSRAIHAGAPANTIGTGPLVWSGVRLPGVRIDHQLTITVVGRDDQRPAGRADRGI